MSSFLTEDRRPEAIGDGGGARKLRTFSGKDSGEVAMEWNEIEGLSEGLSHSAHQNRMEEIKVYLLEAVSGWYLFKGDSVCFRPIHINLDSQTCTFLSKRLSSPKQSKL